MIKLGANILSQRVQRNLTRATSDLSTASERLASGQRINKASDDAAGLAISMGLTADSRVFNQGMRNLNDGISAVSIAEGAMTELGTIVERIQELATQSMNGTLGDVQRASLQKEVTALQSEWNRIVESTSFNGQQLLTGSSTRAVLQGGKGAEGTLALQFGQAAAANAVGNYAQEISRISMAASGGETDGSSSWVTISADGRYVAYTSAATNIVAGDTNGYVDVFLRDMVTGSTTRVSTDSQGGEAVASSSTVTAISGDGRYVLFSTSAGLDPADVNASYDDYVKDTVTGKTTMVGVSSNGTLPNASTTGYAISADGRYVLFGSTATNLVAGDTNGRSDIFRQDMVTGEIIRVNTTSQGVQSTQAALNGSMSADGRFVMFSSTDSGLVSGDSNGTSDLFLKDLSNGSIRLVSTNSSGVQSSAGVTGGRLSADGKFLSFSSSDSVFGALNQYGAFVKNLETGEVVNAATDSNGVAQTLGLHATNLSADGRYALITYTLHPTNPGFPLWRTRLKDLQTGSFEYVDVNSRGEGANGPQMASAISADGRSIVFSSAANYFVEGDTNGQTDIFYRDLSKAGVQQMAGMVVSNRSSASITLNLVQRYRDELLTYRSTLGAASSRISSFLNNLDSAQINYTSAASRIKDADVATESAQAIRSRILQQSASALLAQANQAPQLALRLLSGN